MIKPAAPARRVLGLSLLAVGLFLFGLPAAANARTTPTTPLKTSGPTKTTGPPKTTGTVQAFMTLYGYVDNSPPGTDIAHPCRPNQQGAEGIGTYADPITFATDVKELPWCEIIYVPYMERYFIHEDECSECDRDWKKFKRYRFDMWAGGDAASLQQPEKGALLQCEDTWTRGNTIKDPNNPTITLDPPSDLPVVTTPIFSPPTSCWNGS
jgi:hypothetical protein